MPLVIAALLTNYKIIDLAAYGIVAHLFMDMFFVADGVMLFYPFSKKYYRYLSKATTGVHGKMWLRKYMTLPIFKIDTIAFVILLIILARQYLV